jgi:hypothetical protein
MHNILKYFFQVQEQEQIQNSKSILLLWNTDLRNSKN